MFPESVSGYGRNTQNAPQAKEFFQIVQNKLHWAITGKTAAQLIAERLETVLVK
jgi:hypothetical protein